MPNHTRAYGLYDEPFSTIMLVMLSMVVGANALMLALSIFAVVYIGVKEYQVTYWGVNSAAPIFVNVLFWLCIPLAICTLSSLDLWKLKRQRLQPGRLVLSACASTALWFLTIGLWLPCTFTLSWDTEYEYYYCPYNSPSFTDANNLVPFFAFIPIMCYLLYLTLGIVALRHSRKAKQNSLEAGLQLELDAHKRYKLASGVYTDIDDSASDSLPSTFRGDITSPAPTAQPPSYVTRDPGGGPHSRRASSFFSEMSHWRRDIEMASISGTSHMCTCQCHHGVMPQEHGVTSEEQRAEERGPAVD